MNRNKKVGKIIYSPSYGGGLYSWGYEEAACYMPLINWIEKYKDENEKNSNKLIQELLKEIGIIRTKKKETKYNNKVFIYKYIIHEPEKWIVKIKNIDINKINEEKTKELIKILKNMLDKNVLDEYVIGVLTEELEIEEIYPNEEIYISSFDGTETIEYEYCKDCKKIEYEKVIKLNEKSLKEFQNTRLKKINKMKLL